MLTTLLTSVGVPILLDLIKTAAPALSRRIIGVSVDEQIKLANADIERVKALATLDNPAGTPSQWVIDLRGSFRYIAAAALILAGVVVGLIGVSHNDAAALTAGLELAGSPFGFIFGERLVLSYKGSHK